MTLFMKGKVYFPDLYAHWPWQRVLNHHYDEVKVETHEWIKSFGIFGEKELAAFEKYDFNLLACLVYPYANKEFARVTCDFLHFILIYDDFTDRVGREEADKMSTAVLDAMRNPYVERQKDDVLGEIAQQFWKRALSSTTNPNAPCVKHFISSFDEYTKAVAQEAEDRETSRVRGFTDYLELRKRTFCASAIFALLEFGLDLPEGILEDPLVVEMVDIAAQLLGITNDIHSYAREQAKGLDGHNAITVVMREIGFDVQSALNWLGDYAQKIIERFLSNRKKLQSHHGLQVYIDRLGQLVMGHECWSYETKRYYGNGGEEVRRTRIMTLRAPETPGTSV